MTDTTHMQALDPILHQPVRTRIVAYLAARGESTFTELKQALAMTDGNLEAHLKKLTGSNYVFAKKYTPKNSRPQTTYNLTKTGHKAFAAYVKILGSVLPLE